MQHPIQRKALRPRATFRDTGLQAEFAARGYVIVPLLTADHMSQLTALYRSLTPGIETGFYNIMFCTDADYREQVTAGVQAVMRPVVEALFLDYRPLAGSFMVKLPGPDSELTAHQDWNMVDEHEFVSVNVWAPITPLTGENGALYVMPGSHLFMDGLRPSVFCPTCLAGHEDVVREKFLQRLVVPEGHAVIHNNALVHSSAANRSAAPRIVANLTMIPREARLIHYYLDPSTGDVDYFEVDSQFYLRHLIGQRPAYPVKDTIPRYQAPSLSARELQQRFEEHNGGLPASSRTGA